MIYLCFDHFSDKSCNCQNNGFCTGEGPLKRCICRSGYAGNICESKFTAVTFLFMFACFPLFFQSDITMLLSFDGKYMHAVWFI